MHKLIVLIGFFMLVSPQAVTKAQEMFVYFGSHDPAPGRGFSLSRFDPATGVLGRPQFLVEAKEPAFFVIHPDGKRLYTCNSGSPGGVSAYAIDPPTGQLRLLNQQPAGGGDPSYVSLDNANRHVLVANYQGGNIAVFALEPDGSLGRRTAFVQHTGSSVHPQRQTRPFAHAIITDPFDRFVLVPDLGIDKVLVYRYDASAGTLAPNDPPSAAAKPGSGPRHVRFHPNGKWVYVIHEIGSTIATCAWDAQAGTLRELQTTSTLPAGFTGTSTCAEIEVHPNGRFVYGTNRGHDSIAVFAVDPASGVLSLVEHVPSAGRTPRNFAFDPSARWMIVTNHASNNAVVFRVDEATGRLRQVGEPVEVPEPFCVRFLPAPAAASR